MTDRVACRPSPVAVGAFETVLPRAFDLRFVLPEKAESAPVPELLVVQDFDAELQRQAQRSR